MSLCSQSLHAQIAVPVLSLLLCATLAPAQSTATPPGIRVPALGQMHLCFSRDGSLLRILGDSSSDAGKSGHVQAIAYSVKTGAVVHLVNLQPHVQVLSVTSDGRTAVVLTGMSGDGGSHLALLDTETGRLQPIPESWYEADYPDASISGDGRLVAVYSEPAVVTDRPMTVSVYDWAGKTLVATRTSEYVSAGGA
jgi:hypothetical protein